MCFDNYLHLSCHAVCVLIIIFIFHATLFFQSKCFAVELLVEMFCVGFFVFFFFIWCLTSRRLCSNKNFTACVSTAPKMGHVYRNIKWGGDGNVSVTSAHFSKPVDSMLVLHLASMTAHKVIAEINMKNCIHAANYKPVI